MQPRVLELVPHAHRTPIRAKVQRHAHRVFLLNTHILDLQYVTHAQSVPQMTSKSSVHKHVRQQTGKRFPDIGFLPTSALLVPIYHQSPLNSAHHATPVTTVIAAHKRVLLVPRAKPEVEWVVEVAKHALQVLPLLK